MHYIVVGINYHIHFVSLTLISLSLIHLLMHVSAHGFHSNYCGRKTNGALNGDQSLL